GSLGTDHILTLFVPRMLTIIAFSTGLFTGFGIIDEVRAGVIERLRVTPASRFAILGGHVFFDACSALFQSLLFILIAVPFGFRASVPGLGILFVLLALLVLITSSFGNAVGVIFKSEDRYAPLVHGIHLPVLLLSGTLLPMSLAPLWLRVVAHFNPVYYVVNASRALAVGDFNSVSILYAFIVLIPFAIFTLFWATGVFRRVVT
ncbi:MAG: ABC transporter permease, partial [Chlamydiia bacterium]|nr:ABC transporter permease [Chlamydiia bacterium]